MNERTESHNLVDLFRKDFFADNYDWDKNYGELFFDGNKKKGIPRWAGYEIGYYLVKQIMKKTGKKASELFNLSSENFIEPV